MATTSYLCVYADDNGESHVEVMAASQASADPVAARHHEDTGEGLRVAPQCQLVLLHAGEAQLEASDGSSHRLRPGDAVLVLDVHARGHALRPTGTVPMRTTTLTIPEHDHRTPRRRPREVASPTPGTRRLEVVPLDGERWPPPRPGAVVGIGAYDGVHGLHRAALAELRRLADQRSSACGLILFGGTHSHGTAARQLTSLQHRLELLEETALVDVVWVLPADADSHASTVIPRVLSECVQPIALGTPTAFVAGDGRLGYDSLRSIGAEHGFELISLDHIMPGASMAEAYRYTTDHIRSLLSAGQVSEAGDLLGRLYEMRGVVERGDQRGRQLGFPTANLSIPTDLLIPGEGVFAGIAVTADGTPHAAAISLGRRPTFYAEGFELLEVHLLDFDEDIYGTELRVLFVEHLRAQRRFAGPDDLVAQLSRDIATTRELDTVSAFHQRPC